MKIRSLMYKVAAAALAAAGITCAASSATIGVVGIAAGTSGIHVSNNSASGTATHIVPNRQCKTCQ